MSQTKLTKPQQKYLDLVRVKGWARISRSRHIVGVPLRVAETLVDKGLCRRVTRYSPKYKIPQDCLEIIDPIVVKDSNG